MKIDRKLNLTMPVESDGAPVFLHAQPISRGTFEQHFMLISKAYTAMYMGGAEVAAGPAIASLVLQNMAQGLGLWDDAAKDVKGGLLTEMRRLSNLVIGGEIIPLDDAIRGGRIDDDARADIEGSLVFFTVSSAILRGADLNAMRGGLALMWDADFTSSTVTEFAASLKTSTEAATTGETAAA